MHRAGRSWQQPIQLSDDQIQQGIHAIRWPIGTADQAIDLDESFEAVPDEPAGPECWSAEPAGPEGWSADDFAPPTGDSLLPETPFRLQLQQGGKAQRAGRERRRVRRPTLAPREVRRLGRRGGGPWSMGYRELAPRPGALSAGTELRLSTRGPPGALGMFAATALPQGAVVARLRGAYVQVRDFEARAADDASHEYDGIAWNERLMMVDRGLWTGQAPPGDWYRLNHSLRPNVQMHRGGHEIVFKTNRPIAPDEELLYSYTDFTPPSWLD
jgi:hypothetical protein